MASSPPQTERPDYHDPAHSAEMVEYDRFIDEQIDKTSAQVRWVDISAALMTLAAGWLGFLLAATVVDHWLVSGGLGHVARFACFSALVGGTVIFTVWGILPLVVRRINPVYAAHVIEREEPSLKNSLVNFLLLRSTPRHLTRKTYQALEESAAHGLAEVPVEHIVDRSHVIKVGYVLMAVIVVGCIYKLVSPKDPLQSVGRIVIPWSDLAPASRVRIDDVKPGSVSVFNGQSIEVSAVVSGAGHDEPVRVVYSTSDTRVVDRPIVMERPEGSFRYVATLPEEIDGLEQDVEYRIEAGDARTSTYRVSVSTPPAMIVKSVQYEYPAYTGLGTRVAEGGGDIKAIEGTRVTIRAEANREINKAYVDFECDGRTDLVMAVEADGRHATSTFALAMAADGATPAHTSYQLRFAGNDGQENPRPTRHRIEVIPDTPPEVHFELPGYDGVEVPENAAVRLEVHAQDSDFSLGEVTLFAEHNGKQIVERRLLGEPHAGEFVGQHDLRPGKYRLHAGDEVMYWAEARDLRHPVANRTETVHYRMLIVAPTSAPPPEQATDEKQDQQGDSGDASQGDAENQDQSPPDNKSDAAGDEKDAGKKDAGEKDAGEEGASEKGADETGDQAGDGGKKGDASAGDDRQPGDKQPDRGEANREAGDGTPGDRQRDGERGEAGDKGDKGEPGAGKSGEQDGDDEAREPIDPTSNPGDAFEEILRRREETLESPRDSEGREDNQSDAERNNGQDENAQSKQSPGAEPQGDQNQGNKAPDANGDTSQQQKQKREQGGNSDQQSAAQPQEGKNQDGQGQTGETKDGQAQDGKPGDGDSSGGASDQSGQQPGGSNNADKRDGQQQDAGDSSAGNEQDSANEPSSSGRPTEGDQQPGAQQGQDPTAGRENQQGSTVENSKRDDPAGSQSQSKKPSEAQGGQQGDRAGRGQQGSGQKANQSGTGGAGQNTASDQGGSASEQSGNGPTGQKPGEKPSQPGQGGKQQAGKNGSAGPSDAHQDGQKAGGNQQGGQQGKHEEGGKPQGGEQQSGQPQQGQQSGGQSPSGQQPSGQQSGGQQSGGQQSGSQQSGGKQGQPGGQSGQPGEGSQNQGPSGQGAPGQGSPGQGSAGTSSNGKSDGSPTPNNNQNAQSNPQQGDNGQGDGTGVGGGEPETDRPLPPHDKEDTTALEDEQRLAKAREATNLALEYLRDQLAREKPDPELLKRLGWTRDEMQRFLAHWEEMNRAAQQKGEAGQRASDRLDKMLKGLGISPRARKLSSGIGDDHRRNLASPRRVPPPRGYAEQFKAYTEGAARDRE